MTTRRPLRMGERRRGDPLPTLGDLRKGAPKGSGKAIVGAELNDFRICNYNEADEQLMTFIQSIGTFVQAEPQGYYIANHIGFVFPERTVAENLMVYNECYRGKILIHRCMPDESRLIVRALDPKTLRPIVVNGRHVETGEPVFCDDKPIYSYARKDGTREEVCCSPAVRMKVMLRGQGRVATWDVLSTSGIDGEHLQDQLETFYDGFSASPILGKNGLRGIPFVLHRLPPVDVPFYDANGTRMISKHSFISIEIAPDFGSLYMESTVRYALEAVEPKQIVAPVSEAALGDEIDDEEALDQISGGVETLSSAAPEPEAPAEKTSASDDPATDWKALYEGLGLTRSKYKAALEFKGGSFEEAYKFILNEREEAAKKAKK